MPQQRCCHPPLALNREASVTAGQCARSRRRRRARPCSCASESSGTCACGQCRGRLSLGARGRTCAAGGGLGGCARESSRSCGIWQRARRLPAALAAACERKKARKKERSRSRRPPPHLLLLLLYCLQVLRCCGVVVLWCCDRRFCYWIRFCAVCVPAGGCGSAARTRLCAAGRTPVQ